MWSLLILSVDVRVQIDQVAEYFLSSVLSFWLAPKWFYLVAFIVIANPIVPMSLSNVFWNFVNLKL
jgi:hypothetical protein